MPNTILRCVLALGVLSAGLVAVGGKSDGLASGARPASRPATGPTSRPASRPATRPASRPAAIPVGKITIDLRVGGKCCVKGVGVIPVAELGKHLKTLKAPKQTPVLIKARGDMLWTTVVEAFNQVVRAGFKNVGFDASGQ